MVRLAMLRWIDTIFPRKTLFQRDRRLLYLFVGRVLGSCGFSIVLPFLGLYLHESRGVSMSAVGGVFFFAALAGALGQIVGGELSDRKGRKFVIVGSQLIRVCAFLGLGLAVLLHGPFLAIALLLCVSGFAGRMFEPPSGAMVADIATGERRAEYYGVIRIGSNLGWALGPALGGFLAALSYSSLFFFAAGVILAAAAVMAFKMEETSPLHHKHRVAPAHVSPAVPELGPSSSATTGRGYPWRDLFATLAEPSFRLFCIVSLLLFTVMAQLISTLSVYAVESGGITKLQLGTLYSLNGLVVVFLQFPAVRATGSLRLTTALVLGALLYGLGYGMMGLGTGFALLFTAMLVVSFGEIVATPPSLSLAANFADERTRGRYMGIYGLFNSFGWSIGPLVGGVLLDLNHGRPLVLWGMVAALAAASAAGFLWLRRVIPPDIDRNLEALETSAAVA
jgi:MFS family permease